MPVEMFHHNEIARAIRLLCQGAVRLSADSGGGNEVQVGSNELFEVGDEVTLRDAAGAETHSVVGKVGLTRVVLSGEVGQYLVARGARLVREAGRLEELAWVGQGAPELLPQAPADRFPCVLVLPDVMKQPLGEGGNRVFQQEYSYRVYYVREYGDGQMADMQALEEAGKLFNLLMSDPYLGGTCWHSQVTEVNPSPAVGQVLREQERPLRVVELTVVARRAAVWNR